MLSKRTLKLKYHMNIKVGLSLLKSNYGVCFNVAKRLEQGHLLPVKMNVLNRNVHKNFIFFSLHYLIFELELK